MTRSLTADPPPWHWAEIEPSGPFRVTPFDKSATDIFDCWRAAYPLDHPDHYAGSDEQALKERLEPLLSGSTYGPLLRDQSAAVVETNGRVVACAILNDTPGDAPWGGPWMTDLFRMPHAAYAGLGALLLKRSISRAAASGMRALGLVVTARNPAREIYMRYGFTVADHFKTVKLPE